MRHLAISALFGIALFVFPAVTAQPARAADDTQASFSTNAQPQNLEFAGIKPTFDIARFDSESVLRAVFMTAVLGFVIFGRSAPRSQRSEPYARSASTYTPMPTTMSVPALAGMPSLPFHDFAPPPERTAELAAPAPPDDATERVVWVNTRTGVVHERGTRWFGKTAEGTYVTKRTAGNGTDLAALSNAA